MPTFHNLTAKPRLLQLCCSAPPCNTRSYNCRLFAAVSSSPARIVSDEGAGVNNGDQRVQVQAVHHRVASSAGLSKLVADVLRLSDAAVLQDDPVSRSCMHATGVLGVATLERYT